MAITLRDATPNDLDTIASFNQRLAEETEDKTLADNLIRPGVAAVLNDPSRATYYVACDGDRVVGQLMITLEWSDWRNGWFWWIQSVYIHKDFRKQGIYRSLYKHVKSRAKAAGDVCGIRLYVEHNNDRAQQTYLNLGMENTHYQIMEEEF